MIEGVTRLAVPDFCLVLLVGAAGSGKSSFAARHFRPTEIVSSDHCRALVSDDESDQSASAAAFELVHLITEKRLAARRLTVIDATNVKQHHRQTFLSLARRFHAPVVMCIFMLDHATCVAQVRQRVAAGGRDVPEAVIASQLADLKKGLPGIRKLRKVKALHGFSTASEVAAVEHVERCPPECDRRGDHGPFDIIGDVHGCADELERLLARLGYRVAEQGPPGQRHYEVQPPEGRRALFLGDLVDRGPRTPDVLRLVRGMTEAGNALCLMGNHEARLIRRLRGHDVALTHGLEATLDQLSMQPEGFAAEVLPWLEALPDHFVLDRGDLVVAHAGLKAELQNRVSGKVRAFALYGETTGMTDGDGLPERVDWAADYRGAARVVHGHTPVQEPEWRNRVLCIDTGCCFGGRLTALRWPEMTLVSQPAGHA